MQFSARNVDKVCSFSNTVRNNESAKIYFWCRYIELPLILYDSRDFNTAFLLKYNCVDQNGFHSYDLIRAFMMIIENFLI